jgi:hypothetical protein
MPRSLRVWPKLPVYEPVNAAPVSIAQDPAIGKHLFVESAFLPALLGGSVWSIYLAKGAHNY